MSYRYFTIDERENILKFLALGLTYDQIANELRKHKSSISISTLLLTNILVKITFYGRKELLKYPPYL
ncbi:helix-turn-helix domain-containing protein [uncultured Ilyobacter sp.]|uniref:helix-turn-helix domain-containing protein n=1 Tax=uncultured Ilyobacter sp. TaxID=544433 RepID=UPI003747A346